MTRLLLLLSCIPFLPIRAGAQDIDQLTTPYTQEQCSSCATWNAQQAPFQIHGDTYYVGPHGLSSILIASPEGHILIDGGLPNSAPLILENIRVLGFDPRDIELILNTHAHFDHAGGIAAITHVSGARVAASPESTTALKNGRSEADDPQFGQLLDFPAISTVQRFTPGDTVRVGSAWVVSHATAGHSPGGTSWSWRSCDPQGCLDMVFADSQTPVSADGFRFSDKESVLLDFGRGHLTLDTLSCDILITTHPGASAFWDRYADGPSGLIDPKACRRYATAARKQLSERLDRERSR